MKKLKIACVLVLLFAAAPLRATAQTLPVVDVNDPYIILNSSSARTWSRVTVEVNGYWTFTTGSLPAMKSLCIAATAFTVKVSIRKGRDFDGIHFDPSTMIVKTVTLANANANGPGAPLRVTKGLFKPLTPQEAILCLGR